jgi:hypothetical protein
MTRGMHPGGCGHLGCGCITALWALIWASWALWWLSRVALIILALPVALVIVAGAASMRRRGDRP